MAHLASQGYVVAAPQHHDTDPQRHEHVDRPLDILTVLDGLAAVEDGDLAGMIIPIQLDSWMVGGGAASLQMLRLESDPVHGASWCAEHADLSTGTAIWYRLKKQHATVHNYGWRICPTALAALWRCAYTRRTSDGARWFPLTTDKYWRR